MVITTIIITAIAMSLGAAGRSARRFAHDGYHHRFRRVTRVRRTPLVASERNPLQVCRQGLADAFGQCA
jgi:hypothetical protein